MIPRHSFDENGAVMIDCGSELVLNGGFLWEFVLTKKWHIICFLLARYAIHLSNVFTGLVFLCRVIKRSIWKDLFKSTNTEEGIDMQL